MKPLVSIVLLAMAPASHALDVPRAIEAIRMVENWDGRSVGASREWGHWQFTPAVWREYSTAPHRGASNAEQRRVAEAHARWLMARLAALQMPATPTNLALLWNAGFGAVRSGKIKPRHRDYAQRVANLYSVLTPGPIVAARENACMKNNNPSLPPVAIGVDSEESALLTFGVRGGITFPGAP